MTEEGKTYLGDGVYVCMNAGMVKLTAVGGGNTNTIYLEAIVLAAFIEWVKRQGIQVAQL